jgi:hypothetical protein
MVTDNSFFHTILSCGENTDAWEDVYFAEAYQLYELNKDQFELAKLIEKSKLLSSQNQKRFWQVVASVEQTKDFSVFIDQIKNQLPDIAIYIVDALREWNLNSEQRKELRICAETLKDISPVYDSIIAQI